MEDFKQYLSEGADKSERDAARQVMEGLSGLRLENKVAEVAAERQALLRQRFWSLVIWAAAGVVLIAGATFWLFKQPETKDVQNTAPPIQQQPIANDQAPPQTPEDKKDPNPIAQRNTPDRLPSPRFSSPTIRGENQENKALKALLDQVWYTDYPPAGMVVSAAFEKADAFLKSRDFSNAYVQLQRLERKMPENDTLQYLKGYCLMEMGEGAEALTYFDKVTGKQAGWEMSLEWYKSLSWLLTGDREKALSVFKSIAATPKHSYKEQARKAQQMIK